MCPGLPEQERGGGRCPLSQSPGSREAVRSKGLVTDHHAPAPVEGRAVHTAGVPTVWPEYERLIPRLWNSAGKTSEVLTRQHGGSVCVRVLKPQMNGPK